MDVTPLIRKDAKVIQSYKGGSFKVSGQIYTTSIIILPDTVIEWQLPTGDLTIADFAVLAPYADQIDVLLFGTGDRQIMPPVAVRMALKQQMGIVLEPMDNGAAARTYNVLMAEGRNVAAALTTA